MDNRSEGYLKIRDERRELIVLAVEELIGRTGQLPSASDVNRELGFPPARYSTCNDWDFLHKQGRLPERPNKRLPRRVPGKSFGEQGGALFLEAEKLLRQIGEEIASATPEYRAMAQEFWVTHLDKIIDLAEGNVRQAMGSTVDDFIGQIEKGK